MGKDVEAGSNKLTKFGQSAVEKRGLTPEGDENGKADGSRMIEKVRHFRVSANVAQSPMNASLT